MPSIIHTVGRDLTPELTAWLRELRACSVVYSHGTTAELISACWLAKAGAAYDCLAPTAVVWLQSRPGEFRQTEVDAAIIADPLAKPFLIAGTLCEGEPRSGKLLSDVNRLYWHQGPQALFQLLRSAPCVSARAPIWITIHARQWTDYQGIAGVCRTLGHKTIWQGDQQPAISSEPDVRLFAGWDAWEKWQASVAQHETEPAASAILLLDFPRHADIVRARQAKIARVVALPLRIGDLQQSLETCRRRLPVATAAVPKPEPAHIYRRTA